MESDSIILENKIYSNHNNILLGIVQDLQELINHSKDNIIIKRLSDIIIKMNFIINENKKNTELIMKQIKEMQNQMNKRFDENEKMIKNIHNDFDNINKKNININNANIEKININNLFPLVPKNHKIEQNFDFKPLIGLDFIGAPIFLNATLQCFCNIKEFVDYFKYNQALIDKIKQDTQNYTLCRSFKLLIENLYPHELSKIGKNRAFIKKNIVILQMIS